VKIKAKKLTVIALSVSLAMIFSFVESQIPPLAMVPGVKIGLANIVTVFLLYSLGVPETVIVSLIRVFFFSPHRSVNGSITIFGIFIKLFVLD